MGDQPVRLAGWQAPEGVTCVENSVGILHFHDEGK